MLPAEAFNFPRYGCLGTAGAAWKSKILGGAHITTHFFWHFLNAD
jgi:hypothetical protein